MSERRERVHAEVLRIGPRIDVLPVIHGSADYATEVRRRLVSGRYDALAVPLPESFRAPLEPAILELPRPSLVIQPQGEVGDWESEEDEEGDDDRELGACNYVPVDPCQPVIAALRFALEERLTRYYIDAETSHFVPYGQAMPDPYALRRVSLERFAAGLLPAIARPEELQRQLRIRWMARRLRELAIDHRAILLVCSVLDWPWIRDAYQRFEPMDYEPPEVETPRHYAVDFRSLYFLLGELPFITSLYEQARANLTDPTHLAIDGVKELLLAARDAYRERYGKVGRKISPLALRTVLKYARNLTLLDRRLTPELSTLLTASKQVLGDAYAHRVLEVARRYDAAEESEESKVRLGHGRGVLPEHPSSPMIMISRLPGPPTMLHRVELAAEPDELERHRPRQGWTPSGQCSWPPEDIRIERFRATVFDRAREVLGHDLARTEKFTTSLMDGIDIRETLRNWHEGSLYVQVLPPRRGDLDAVVMLFDSPADPREYPWRTTWYAEHTEESTLAFFASDFRKDPVGPGIHVARYGGALFLYPPRPIPDVWIDPRLDEATTLEERLLAAAALHARKANVAVVSSAPPGAAWRRIARRFRRRWIHLPWSKFSDETVQQLRLVHVLGGREVRSWAERYIRRIYSDEWWNM